MRGETRQRRLAAWALTGALLTAPVVAVVGGPAGPAAADTASVPGRLSTAAQNTSSVAVPVPAGVEVRALDAGLTMREVVEGGTVTFRINGAVRTQVPSALY